MKMTIQELYRSVNKQVATIYVIPRIEVFSIHNPYLKLFYKEFFSTDTQSTIRIISPHPLAPSFLFKRILGEQSIVHYHWIQFFSITGFFVLFWKMSWVLLYKLLGGKIIWSVHNKQLHSKKYLLLNTFFRKLMANTADRLHVHCEEAVHVMAPILTVLEEKFVVIEHPMYPATILDKNEAQKYCRDTLVRGCDFTQPVFLMYGNIGEYKGIAEVIPFFSYGIGQLIIAGDCKKGEHRYLEKIKSETAGGKNFYLVNRFLSKEEEMYLFNAVDCVLFNFRDMLTSGSIMLALSYKKEIIVPYIGCVKNLSGPGITTFTTQEELKDLIIAFAEKYKRSRL
jgi:beta-1,4-mannosyltransferase